MIGGFDAARAAFGGVCRSFGGGGREPSSGGDRGADRLGGGGSVAGAGLCRADRPGVVPGAEPVQGGAVGGVVRAGRPGAGGGVGRPAVGSGVGWAGAGFAEVNRQLEVRGLVVKAGTLVDATLVRAAAAEPPKQKGGGRSKV